jgi:hypothetical protein
MIEKAQESTMKKTVGVKFAELKSQISQRDLTASLQKFDTCSYCNEHMDL